MDSAAVIEVSFFSVSSALIFFFAGNGGFEFDSEDPWMFLTGVNMSSLFLKISRSGKNSKGGKKVTIPECQNVIEFV